MCPATPRWTRTAGTSAPPLPPPASPCCSAEDWKCATVSIHAAILACYCPVQQRPAATLAVYGGGVLPQSVVQHNDTPLATTYISATHLQAVIPEAEEGKYSLTVSDPGAIS